MGFGLGVFVFPNMVGRSSVLAFAKMMVGVGGLRMLLAMICCSTALVFVVVARGHCRRNHCCRQGQIVISDGGCGGIRRCGTS